MRRTTHLASNRMFELFVVFAVVVLACAVSFIFLSDILEQARDAKRINDIAAVRNALELYHLDHGTYPSTGWTNSATESWDTLGQMLRPYITAMPIDPINDASGRVEHTGAFNYTYYSVKKENGAGGTAGGSDYLIVFHLEKPKRASEYQQADVGLVTAHGTVTFLKLTHADGIYVVRAP